MIRFVIIIILFFSITASASDRVLPDKEQLQLLLKERKQHFDGYMTSLNEKSGFFGGKSKKDLQKSQDILVEIVKLDNRVMSILSRQLDYKDFEKTEMTYRSVQDYEQQDQLSVELAAVKKELTVLRNRESQHRLSMRIRNTVIFLLIASLFFTYLLPRIKSIRNSKNAVS